MKYRRASVFLLLAALATQMSMGMTLAQEPTVINEIIVRVNTDIITLATYQRNKSELENEQKQKNLPPDKFKEETDKMTSELLQTMIDERLLAQKARELDIDVDAQVNQQWIELAQQNGFKTVREFEDAIKANGISPDTMRESLKISLLRDAVIRQEVFGPIYRHITEPEARTAYQDNLKQFSTPAEASLSEIFIGLSGRSTNEAESMGKTAVADARRGADFKNLVQKYSDSNRKSKANQGVLGSFKIDVLEPAIAEAVGKLKAGEVTDPVFSQKQGGYMILRADAVKPAAARPFEEVKEQIYSYVAYQKGSGNIQEYIKKLRKRAYIKVTEGYENLLPTNTPAKAETKSQS